MNRSERDSVWIGLAVTTHLEQSSEGPVYVYRPDGLEPYHGFSVDVLVGWRSLIATFTAEPYSSGLLAQMKASDRSSRSPFWRLVQKYESQGAKFTFAVDGIPLQAADAPAWEGDWVGVLMTLESPPMETSSADRVAAEWAAKMFALVLGLLPVPTGVDVLPEGSMVGREEGEPGWRPELTRTRNSANRMACIQLRGTHCLACGTDMGEVYGEPGEGFIEVHHLEPLASYDGARRVDPETDLAPVCPNCHAILHRTTPPMSIETLRSLLFSRKERE